MFMNRNVLAFLLCMMSLFAAIAPSNGQSRLIHYWNFNHGTCSPMYTPSIVGVAADYSLIDTSKAKILYKEMAGVSAAYSTYIDTVSATVADYDTLNARRGESSGLALRVRNRSDSMELRFYIPSTNYKNLVLKYATEASSRTHGQLMQDFSYSTDSGATWRTSGLSITSDSAGVWDGTQVIYSLVNVNFTTDTTVNNNPRLVFRILFQGNDTFTSGNNRFDNVTLEGDTIIACTTPSAGAITGSSVVCIGASTTLACSGSIGGTWTSNVTSIATVNSGGTVGGVTAGIDTIKYTITNTCGTAVATFPITVSAPPVAGSITGTFTVCQGVMDTLGDAVGGGTWSVSSATVATISPSGVAEGLSGGSTIVTYSITTPCGSNYTTRVLTINPLPATGTITGTATACAGTTTTLADATTGGVWSSSNTSVATVSTSGVVTAVSGGTATISYTTTNSCGNNSATDVVTITALPSAGTITGTDSVCIGSTTTLADAVTGGTWGGGSSIASVNATGTVTGFAGGVDSIKYTVTNSCGSSYAAVAVHVLTAAQCAALSVSNIPAIAPMSIFPNPAHGMFTIAAPFATTKTTITITDAYGKLIETRVVENASGVNETFNLNNTAAGIYLIKVETNGQSYHDKIVNW